MVLIFTMLKEGYEDYGRFKSDRETNHKTTLMYDQKIEDFKEVF